MSSLGKLGRFGNQLLQYAFLKICAHKSGARIECPPWVGQTLFGLNDPPIAKQLPPAIEKWDSADNMFDAIPEAIGYVEKQTGQRSVRVRWDAIESGLTNVDLWGFFQIHTRYLQPHKELFHSLFQPVPELREAVDKGVDRLRSMGKTIISLHLRRGDTVDNPLFGYHYIVPHAWWKEWLRQVWGEFDQPILYLCSDNLEDVIDDFQEFGPVTWRDLDVVLPEKMKKLDYYVDFYVLSQSDVVAVSNSTFSFVAALLNERARLFVRPHWDFTTRLARFDPWNSEQLLYSRSDRRKMFRPLSHAMEIAWALEGMAGLAKCLYYYPKTRLKFKAARLKFGYDTAGFKGLVRSLFSGLYSNSGEKFRHPKLGLQPER
jgi:hypothetical protein